MWCLRIRKQLSAYTDGELAPAEARGVEQHLTRCARCSGEVQELRKLARLTALVPEEEVPAGLHARIMTRLAYADAAPAARPASRRPILLGPWAAAALSGAAAVVVLGLFHWRPPALAPAHTAAAVAVRTFTPAPDPVKPTVPASTPTAEAPRPATVEASTEPAPPPQKEPDSLVPAAAKPAPPRPATRTAKRTVTAPSSASPGEVKDARTLPAAGPDKPTPDAPATMAMAPGAGTTTPGDAAANGTGPEPVMIGMEKDGVTRMAGMTPDPDPLPDEDEGLRPARMFLEERLRNVPQPPLLEPGRDRRMRKSL